MREQKLILVVEDNAINQVLTSAVLEREGYTVRVVGSAEEALEFLGHDTPDLILMDINFLGRMVSLAKALKAAAGTAGSRSSPSPRLP